MSLKENNKIIKSLLSNERIKKTSSFIFKWLNDKQLLITPPGEKPEQFFNKQYKEFNDKLKKLLLISALTENPRLNTLIRNGGTLILYLGFRFKAEKWTPVLCLKTQSGRYEASAFSLSTLSVKSPYFPSDIQRIFEILSYEVIYE